MVQDWPNKKEREEFEINKFVKFYEPGGRSFKVVRRGDSHFAGPDYIVQDAKTGENFGVELVSVYLGNRSVPDVHKKVISSNDLMMIPCETHKIEEYEKRILESVAEKIRKVEEYDKGFPLIMSVYVNEYISIFMDEKSFQRLVSTNENLFDGIAPFSEIVFWPLPNGVVFSVKP